MRNLLLLTLVNFLWALQFPTAKRASAEAGPMTVTMVSLLLSIAFLLPLAHRERRTWPAVGRPGIGRAWAALALLGVMGSLVAQLFLNWGVERSLATNASVIYLTTPVLMALLASAMLGERMRGTRWVAFAISIGGVLLVSAGDLREARLAETRYLVGNALVLLSCFGSAFYNVYSKRLLHWYGPAQLLVASFGFAVPVLLPAMLYYEPDAWRRLQGISVVAWANIFSIAALSVSLAMVLFFRVLHRIDAMQASLSIYLMSVFGVLLAQAALDEKITPALVAGGLLICAGAYLIIVYEERHPLHGT